MNRQTKVTVALWAFVLVGFYLISRGSAKDSVSPVTISNRVARSDGESRTQVTVSVGSTTPVSPFSFLSTGGGSTPTAVVPVGPGFLSDAVGAQLTELRRISFVNDSSFTVVLGTWSGFTPNQAYWSVWKASITFTGVIPPYPPVSYETFNRSTFYMLLESSSSPVGVTTQTFKVSFEK